jgi:hypothetical protein
VELIIPLGTTATQVNFPDIPELRSDDEKDAVIFSIGVSCAAAVPLTYSGNPNATLAQVQNGFVTLYVLGTEKVFRLELQRCMNINSLTSGFYFMNETFELEPQRVDWTKSYVSFGAIGTTDTPSYSYMFTFAYDWLPSGSYRKYLQQQEAQWNLGIIRTA